MTDSEGAALRKLPCCKGVEDTGPRMNIQLAVLRGKWEIRLRGLFWGGLCSSS